MCTVRFVSFSIINEPCFPNGLRDLAFLITLASFTRTLSALRFGLILGACSEYKIIMMDQRICCVNCNIRVNSSNTQNRHLVLEQNTRVISLISNWMSPIIITEDDYICEECFHLAVQTVNEQLHGECEGDRCAGPSHRGHREVCVVCGRSLINHQSHLILNEMAHNPQFMQLVENKVAPRKIAPSDRLCHACFMRTKRHTLRNQGIDELRTIGMSASLEDTAITDNMHPEDLNMQNPSDHNNESEIILEEADTSQERTRSASPEASHQQQIPDTILRNYKRAPNTASHCIFYNCSNVRLHLISDSLRLTLVANYNYYIPMHARVCSEHLFQNSWDSLYESENSLSNFTVDQIEHMLSFINAPRPFLDFGSMESVQQIDDHLFGYWIGLTKNNFIFLLYDVPRILDTHRGILGLACILIKMRTGDSDERISTLLQIPRTTLERLMGNVRKILLQDFVTRNLGLNHISREETLQHNLLIPNGIYNENNTRAITICDGTYIFLNKSGNYMFQKDTYSLHKYRNLMKPFMLVLSDGYILNCYGPYKATTSDADIIISLFHNENSLIRQYFQPNDIFILDRGFRDSISLLESCNYKVYVPDTLNEGEHQLTTTQANQSRCVTIVRWVVEVVNGYFKRDFRLFRFDHFNKNVPNMMAYFQIGAALLNKFGVRLHDRVDAVQIVNIIRDRMTLQNNLSEAVNTLNLNRRSSFFRSITAHGNNILFPRLQYEELILFALGTYQIRQARSYYGEHVRFHGGYRIEVSREMFEMAEFNVRGSGDNSLIRGKIKPRHVNRRQYYVYIIIENNMNGRGGIPEYCCSCLVGRRTVGCCAHVMTLVWYLAWAKYENNIVPPAGVLDDVIVREDDE